MTHIRFGACRLDLDGRRLYRDEQEVHVTPKAYDLLRVLIDNRERALSKAELSERIWPDTYVTEDGLARLINEIRNAIGDEARTPRWIRTVHGYGYSFQGQVDDAVADGPAHFTLRWASREFPLREGENVIGRDPAAAVTIDAPIVSRRHARIVVTKGLARIEDLGSKNGTFVADERITGPTPLRDGDEIRVGDFSLVFHETSAHPTVTQLL
jgi:DNA-binding winged helix-turn-helix (wHTH) protein